MRERLGKEDLTFSDSNRCAYYIDKFGNVTLGLPSKKNRYIGQLMFVTDKRLVFFCKRSEQLHLFRTINAYGFNNFIMETFKPDIIHVEVTTPTQEYALSVTREVFERESKFLKFSQQGFELQKFLGLEKFERIERNDD